MNFEWMGECDGCDWTGSHVLADVAFEQLRAHNQAAHADTAKGRIIPFIIDGLPTIPDPMER